MSKEKKENSNSTGPLVGIAIMTMVGFFYLVAIIDGLSYEQKEKVKFENRKEGFEKRKKFDELVRRSSNSVIIVTGEKDSLNKLVPKQEPIGYLLSNGVAHALYE